MIAPLLMFTHPLKHFTSVTLWRKKGPDRRCVCVKGKGFSVNAEQEERQLRTYRGKKKKIKLLAEPIAAFPN